MIHVWINHKRENRENDRTLQVLSRPSTKIHNRNSTKLLPLFLKVNLEANQISVISMINLEHYHAQTHTHTHVCTHVRTHTRTHVHTHTEDTFILDTHI